MLYKKWSFQAVCNTVLNDFLIRCYDLIGNSIFGENIRKRGKNVRRWGVSTRRELTTVIRFLMVTRTEELSKVIARREQRK